MFLPILLQKIWLYSGFFYFSLLLAIILNYLVNFKKLLFLLTLIINVFFVCLNSGKILFNNLEQNFQQSLLTYEDKMNAISFNQYSFLNSVDNFLPLDSNVCYPWPNDIAGRYASQYLYPRKVLLSETIINNCDYLVLDHCLQEKKYDLEKSIDDNNTILVYKSNLGKVYKIIKYDY